MPLNKGKVLVQLRLSPGAYERLKKYSGRAKMSMNRFMALLLRTTAGRKSGK